MDERRLGNIYGFNGGNYAGNVYDREMLSPAIRTYQGGNQQPMIVCINTKKENGKQEKHMEKPIVAMRGRNPDSPSDRTAEVPAGQRLGPNSQGICNTLASAKKDNMVQESRVLTPKRTEYGRAIRKAYESGEVSESRHNMTGLCPRHDGVSNTLTTVTKDNLVLEPTYRIRKLTPLECWRLMGFSDDDFKMAAEVNSNTQLYKQAGNSIVEDVLMAIFGQMT